MSGAPATTTSPIFVVEHLDPEIGQWSRLEYTTIAEESKLVGCQFQLLNIAKTIRKDLPDTLYALPNVTVSEDRAEEVLASPHSKGKVCLLDPAAKEPLEPADGDVFDYFVFGGILGDDPPRDRTAELRAKGFPGRNLGSVQMTTDTAVRVTRQVIMQKAGLQSIPYVDFPDLRFNRYESAEMPFRYIKDDDGGPLMPKGMKELIAKDSEKGLKDLF